MTFLFARLRAGLLRPLVFASLLGLACGAAPVMPVAQAQAQTAAVSYAASRIVVRGDLGGDVGARANKIRAMAAAGQSVAIQGTCYSACTMYLGLPGSCVNSKSRLGFHRPSYFGLSLSPAKFEFWSQVIAAHYPPPLRRWYLREGRYSASLLMVTGAQLIDLGVPECS
ncbi:hypothetical protein [Rhodobacter lacus]|uniref:Uncharacterized protein n=1 Tax=Rhodobacter lacus TaxID=1641972 RepID=A0ABW5AC48_9RHOB